MQGFMPIVRRCVFVISCLAAPAAPAAMIAFEAPSTAQFSVGDSFSLQLTGSDFASTLDGGGCCAQFGAVTQQMIAGTIEIKPW